LQELKFDAQKELAPGGAAKSGYVFVCSLYNPQKVKMTLRFLIIGSIAHNNYKSF
jgi:Mn-containing catalase